MLSSPSRERVAAFLKLVLLVDAATGLATGALLLLAHVWLAAQLALPAPLLFWAGVSLLPSAALMLAAALGVPDRPVLVWLVIAGNAGWVAGSALCALILPANFFGVVFLFAQGAAVAVLAGLEAMGLRRLTRVNALPA